MTQEERLYDSELYGGCEGGAEAPLRCCPECGAVLDAEDDVLYTAADAEYVVGCSRCVEIHRTENWGWGA